MAVFTSEFRDDNVPAAEAWKLITDKIKQGNKSVEVLSRTIGGKRQWEFRAWDGIRGDQSNAAGASPNTPF